MSVAPVPLSAGAGNVINVNEGSIQAIVVHRDFKPLFANKAYAEMFGFESVEALLAEPSILPLIPEDQRGRAADDYGKLISGKRSSTRLRVSSVRLDGRAIWTDLVDYVVTWHGEPAVQVTLVDVTAEVEAAAREEAQAALVQAAFAAMPDALCVLDPAGREIMANPRFSTFWLADAPSREDPHFHRRAVAEPLVQLRDKGESRVELETPCGRIVDVRLSAGPAGGHVLTYVDVTEHKRLEDQLRRLATTDALTGVYNRRTILEIAEREIARAIRYEKPLAMLMLDIDHFKRVNDTYGHQAGDEVIRNVCNICSSEIRGADFFGRLGGEEFGVILPETAIDPAWHLADRLRDLIAGSVMDEVAEGFRVSVSIGVSQRRPADSVEALMQRADAALYAAKRAGRNRVARADQLTGEVTAGP